MNSNKSNGIFNSTNISNGNYKSTKRFTQTKKSLEEPLVNLHLQILEILARINNKTISREELYEITNKLVKFKIISKITQGQILNGTNGTELLVQHLKAQVECLTLSIKDLQATQRLIIKGHCTLQLEYMQRVLLAVDPNAKFIKSLINETQEFNKPQQELLLQYIQLLAKNPCEKQILDTLPTILGKFLFTTNHWTTDNIFLVSQLSEKKMESIHISNTTPQEINIILEHAQRYILSKKCTLMRKKNKIIATPTDTAGPAQHHKKEIGNGCNNAPMQGRYELDMIASILDKLHLNEEESIKLFSIYFRNRDAFQSLLHKIDYQSILSIIHVLNRVNRDNHALSNKLRLFFRDFALHAHEPAPEHTLLINLLDSLAIQHLDLIQNILDSRQTKKEEIIELIPDTMEEEMIPQLLESTMSIINYFNKTTSIFHTEELPQTEVSSKNTRRSVINAININDSQMSSQSLDN